MDLPNRRVYNVWELRHNHADRLRVFAVAKKCKPEVVFSGLALGCMCDSSDNGKYVLGMDQQHKNDYLRCSGTLFHPGFSLVDLTVVY